MGVSANSTNRSGSNVDNMNASSNSTSERNSKTLHTLVDYTKLMSSLKYQDRLWVAVNGILTMFPDQFSPILKAMRNRNKYLQRATRSKRKNDVKPTRSLPYKKLHATKTATIKQLKQAFGGRNPPRTRHRTDLGNLYVNRNVIMYDVMDVNTS